MSSKTAGASPSSAWTAPWSPRPAGRTDDTEGLINLPLTVKEIQAVVFFKEIDATHFRVSMRSKGDIDVCAIAKTFGGGGHKNASGCTVEGTYADARRQLVTRLTEAMAPTAGNPAR